MVKEAEPGQARHGNFPKLCIPHIVCIVIEHYSDPETSFKRFYVCEKQHELYTFILWPTTIDMGSQLIKCK